jgi:hypothetical protein
VYDLSLVERGGNEAGDEVGGAGDKVEETHGFRLGFSFHHRLSILSSNLSLSNPNHNTTSQNHINKTPHKLNMKSFTISLALLVASASA